MVDCAARSVKPPASLLTLGASRGKLRTKTMEQPPDATGLHAHDLRHYLSLLACDLRLTRERLAETAEDATARATALAGLLARLDAGLAELDASLRGHRGPAPVAAPDGDLAPLVERLWRSFLRAGRLRPGKAALHLARPLLWPGDPKQWQSLVMNLLENACKAAPDGPVRLEADGERLSVSNGGAPPAEALLRALADGVAPPARADGHGQGLGLILAAASALHLRVEPALEPGRFTLNLFRAVAGAPALLLVEDDEDLRAMLAEYLRAEGFRVEASADAAELAPAAGRYRAVVADLNLPGTGGGALLAAWRAADPGLVTVLLTGDSEAQERDWPGVDAVLIKPGLGRLLELLAPLKGDGR